MTPMIRTRRVIAADCLPNRIPATTAAVVYLLMDKFGAPGWAIGAALGVFALAALAILIDNWYLIRANAPGFGTTWRARP